MRCSNQEIKGLRQRSSRPQDVIKEIEGWKEGMRPRSGEFVAIVIKGLRVSDTENQGGCEGGRGVAHQ
eukprot:1137056-Pelagomonas_calceolata.AAC.9